MSELKCKSAAAQRSVITHRALTQILRESKLCTAHQHEKRNTNYTLGVNAHFKLHPVPSCSLITPCQKNNTFLPLSFLALLASCAVCRREDLARRVDLNVRSNKNKPLTITGFLTGFQTVIMSHCSCFDACLSK